jgi:uncharacterized membrane protein
MDLLGPFFSLYGLLFLALLVVEILAVVDAASRRSEAFRAADKQSKAFWLTILGLAAAWNLLVSRGLGLLNLIGLVATIVYVVDVRPALRQLGRGGRGGSGRTMGPYGPW